MTIARTITREFVTLSLRIGLTLAGIQTAQAAVSMQQHLESPVTWIHFILYSLGGFLLLAAILLLPFVLIGLVRSIFVRMWDAISIRKFFLTGAVGTALILFVGGLMPRLAAPIVAAGGSQIRSGIAIFLLVLAAYFLAYIFSVGVIHIIESRSVRIQRVFFWNWWIFLSTVPAMGVSISTVMDWPTLVSLPVTVVLAIVVFLSAVRIVGKTSDWLLVGGSVRMWLIVAGLGILFMVTRGFPVYERDGSPETGTRPPIVFITIDTLRPDALGCYPEGRALRLGTPNIDRLAEEGVVFERAYASAPWTLPSVASFLSGLHPQAHSAVDYTSSNLTEGATTLPEILRESGYATCGIAVNSFLYDGSGIEQGFQTYIEEQTYQQGNRRLLFQKLIDRIRLTWPEPLNPNYNPYMERDAVRRASRFIGEHTGERFFLWVHLFSPHLTYYPPKMYRDRVESELGITVPRSEVTHQEGMKEGWPSVTEENLEGMLGYYAGEVAFADANVGRILDTLDRQGLLERALVIVSSDHGEEFYEQDRFVHAHSLYLEQMHVPLIIRWPGAIESGTRIEQPVSLVDIPPTVLHLLDIQPQLSGSDAEFTGSTLVPLLMDDRVDRGPVFFESPLYFDRNLKGVIYGDLLYIGGDDAVLRPRLYDLSDDPAAYFDIIRDRPDDAAFLSELLLQHADLCGEIADRIKAGSGVADIERFRSLGYIN